MPTPAQRKKRQTKRSELAANGGVFLIESSADQGVQLEAADAEGKTLRRFTMTAYTGVKIQLANFPHPVVVDLAGVKVSSKSRPILRDHDHSRIVGHTNSIEINDGTLTISGTVSAANENAREITESADNGFPWQSSIGARATRMVFVDKGETVEANGRKFTGPLYLARQSVLGEVSFVALGADDNTSATMAAKATSNHRRHAMKFEQWIEAKGFDADQLGDDAMATLQAAFDLEQKPVVEAGTDGGSTDGTIDALQTLRANAAAEVERIAAISKLAGGQPDIEAKAIREGWDAQRVELEVLRASRPTAPTGYAPQADELTAPVIECSLLQATGVSEKQLGEWYGEKVVNAAVSKKNRGMTLHALLTHTLHAAGERYHGANHKSDDFIRAALRADQKIQAGGFSTLATTNILENVANKTLIAAYTAVETVWQFICARRSFSDFKVQSRYRLDSEGAFKKVASDGELKHISLTDAKYTSQLSTYGAMVALTRQDMINDDLDAFLQLPRMLGRLGALRVEELVFVTLLSNPSSFFAAGNNNLISGASSALSIASITTARQNFRDQTSDGKPILVSPTILLVPTGLEETANQLFAESRTDITTTADTQKFANNPHVGLFRPYVSPFINNTNILDQDGAAISGQSATQWYLFADPRNRAAMNIGFLNGQSMPTIDSAETDFNTLGMQWRAYFDFGVGMEETIAAVKSAGV